jgi:hypothetical protein
VPYQEVAAGETAAPMLEKLKSDLTIRNYSPISETSTTTRSNIREYYKKSLQLQPTRTEVRTDMATVLQAKRYQKLDLSRG